MLASMAFELYSRIRPPNNFGLKIGFKITSFEVVNFFKAVKRGRPSASSKGLAKINVTVVIALNLERIL